MNKNNFEKNKKYGKKGSYRPKNKGNKPKPADKIDKAEESKSQPGDVNNPAYYYEDANTLGQIMNFSFNQFGGVPFYVNRNSDGRYSTHNPMVAAYYLNPSLPVGDSAFSNGVSGATIASLRNYLTLSGSNAKTTTYAPQDVTMLELALAEILKMSTFCARAFGIAYLFNYRNRSYPETLLEAMKIDPDDFCANLAQYRITFNKMMAVASRIPFPSTIPLFHKAASLYGSIYVDDQDSALAQTYMFCPATVWVYNEAYNDNGAGLETRNWSYGGTGELVPFEFYLTTLEDAINALLNSTALNAIYSDILRLVQNGKITQLISFGTVSEDMMIVPTYNQEIVDWLHNAIIMGRPLDTDEQYNPDSNIPLTKLNDVSCDASNNAVLYYPQFKFASNFGVEALLDFDHDSVSLEDRVRATRFSHRYTSIQNDSDKYWYTNHLALNDEYIVSLGIYSSVETGNFDVAESCFNLGAMDHAVSGTDMVNIMHNLSKFDWAPFIYLVGTSNLRIMGDMDYYTLLSYDDLNKMYDYEILHFLQIQ